MKKIKYFLAIFIVCLFFVTPAFANLAASVALVGGGPSTINLGEITQLQIVLSNNNEIAPITGVTFANILPGVLPNGLKVSGVATYSCTDPANPGYVTIGVLNVPNGGQSISLAGGEIPARDGVGATDGTCTIIVPITAESSTGSSATYTYQIASGAVTGNDGVPVANVGAVAQGISTIAVLRPSVSKSFDSSTLVFGGASTTLTITITNPNAIALTNFNITDNFPTLGGGGALIQVANPTNATSVCAGAGVPAVFSPVSGGVSINGTGGTVAANSTCTITVDVEARHVNGLYQTPFTSNTIVGATDFDNDLGLQPLNASANVRTRSPLNVAKSFNNSQIASTQSGAFNIAFSNAGDSPLVMTSFTDSPIDGVGNPAFGLKVDSVSMACTAGGIGGSYILTAGNLGIVQTGPTTIPVGGSCILTTNFTATSETNNVPRSFTNAIPEGAAVIGASPGIISQSTSSSILVSDGLRILKSSTPNNPAPGNPVRYDITIQNWSTSIINNIVTTDALTNGQTFLTGIIGGVNYTPTLFGVGCVGLTVPTILGATSVSLTIATVPARISAFIPANCVMRFWAMTDINAADNAVVENVIPAGAVCYGGGGTCNGSASGTTSSNIDADTLSVAKAFSPVGPLPENAISRMTITLSNLSLNEIAAVSVTDNLPAATVGSGQLRIASPPNAVSTCGTPVITAAPNSTSITMNGGIISARASNGFGAAGTCVLQVDVTGNAGSYNNTAVAAGTQVFANGVGAVISPVNSNMANIVYTSSLSAAKTFIPSSVSSGGQSTVIIRLNNNGSIPLMGVGVTDPLPAGMVLANPVNAQTTCAGSVLFTGNSGASSIVMTDAEIAGNGNCDFLFDVVATGAADWVNTVPAGNIIADGGVANQTAVVGTLVFNPPTGVIISKATNPSTLAFPGQSSLLTVTLTNGATTVTGLSFTDYFTVDGTSGAAANGMRISATPAATTTCSGGIITAVPDGTSFSISGITLAGAGSCNVQLNVTSTVIGGITNFIPSGGVSTDQGLTNSGQATTSLTTQGNIGVTKQFTPNIIEPNERSRLRITFFNPTSQPASNISVLDNMPAGVTIPVGANPTTTCTGASVTSPTITQVNITGATIPAASGGISESCYSEIDVIASVAGDYTNIIPAGDVTGTIGGIPVSNAQPTSDILRVKSPLVINKAIGGFTLDVGNPTGFTTGNAVRAVGSTAPLVISLTNSNTTPLTQASVIDNLPAGLVVAPTPAASTTCAGGLVTALPSSTLVSLTGATIPANGACTITIQVLSNIIGTYINTISAGSVTTFEGVTNEEATSAQIVISAPPAVSKDFLPAVIPAGGTSNLTIYFSNDNTTDMTLTSLFTDTLPIAPGNVLVATPPNITQTCPGVVTAVANSGTISYANGSIIPAGGCSISVDVTASVAGVHTNNIPAAALQTNFGNNPQPANSELTVSTLGYISGRVFVDNNLVPNGTFESGTDTFLFGITIERRAGADCNGALLETTTTTASGSYIFTGLAAGTYSVCQLAQPTSTVNSTTTAGSIVSLGGSTGTAGTASNPTTTTSQIVNIVLNNDGGAGEVSGSLGNNFSEIILSQISGRVFGDANNNGIQNGADLGIAGVTVELLNSIGTVIDTQVTDASGNYIFINIPAGTYSVRQPTQPAGTNNGITTAGNVSNGGTDGTPTAVGVLPSQIANIILPPNTIVTGNNFAEITNSRTITGSVFLDYDNNASENGSDYGLAGVTIDLTGTDVNGAPVSASTVTLANGSYSFINLPEGTYIVTQSAQPTGTVNGTTTAGTTGGVASNPTGTTSQITGISLTGANILSAGNVFPEVPNASPDLTIAKTHSPASFAEGSNTGKFTITPENIGAADTSGIITITDTLPAGLTLASLPIGTGWTCGGAIGASAFTCTSTTVILAGTTSNTISFDVLVALGTTGQLLINRVVISGGGEPIGFDGNNTATDAVAISTSASIGGTIWRDINHDRIIDAGEELIAGWTVELLLNGNVVGTQVSAANGSYTFTNVSPGSGYEIRFREPITNLIFGNAVTNEQGIAPVSGVRDAATSSNNGTNTGNPAGVNTTAGTGTLTGLTIFAGDNIIEQSLPLDPAGIVYNAVTRAPVQGASVTITGPAGFNPAIHLVGGAGTVVTGADGFYQFLLTPIAPVGTYTLAVTTYPGGFIPLPSALIPVCANTLTVGAVPDPALVHDNVNAPTLAAPTHNPATCPATTAGLAPANQATTQYYFTFVLNAATSGDLVNNHIPLDPINSGDIVLTKTTPVVNTSIGQLVPYTITANNTSVNNLINLDVTDNLPAGFKYVKGSGSLNGVSLEPTINSGPSVVWENQTLNAGEIKTYKMILIVGSGVDIGEYTNRVQILGSGVAVSNIATATVRVIPDPVFDCSDIIGKVFDDNNANGYQDEGEEGIANVRIATLTGLLVTTDPYGRFHVACGDIPDAERGSNFLMKLDERTLPTGYRITTENPRSIRVTRGKMTKLNFGAAIHRVVRIDMQDSAFIKDKLELKSEWLKEIYALPNKLKSGPTVLRIAYTLGNEALDLAKERLKYVVNILEEEWESKNCCHEIMIEEEMIVPAGKGVVK